MKVYIIAKPVGIKKIITYPDTMSVITVSGDTEFVEKKDILPCIQMLLSDNKISMKLAQEIAKDYPNEFKYQTLKTNDVADTLTFVTRETRIAHMDSDKYQEDLNEAIMNSLQMQSQEEMDTIIQEQIKLAQQSNNLKNVARAVCFEYTNTAFNIAGFQNSLNQNLLSKQSHFAYSDTFRTIQSHSISHFNIEFENCTKRDGRNVLLTVTSECMDKDQLYITNAEKQAILKCHDEVKFAGILKDIPNGNWLADTIESASVNGTPRLN